MSTAQRPPRHAFTLLETLLVLMIIVIAAALAFPAVQGMLDDARETAAGDMIRGKAAETRTAPSETGKAWRLAYLEYRRRAVRHRRRRGLEQHRRPKPNGERRVDSRRVAQGHRPDDDDHDDYQRCRERRPRAGPGPAGRPSPSISTTAAPPRRYDHQFRQKRHAADGIADSGITGSAALLSAKEVKDLQP